jgi:TonB family protein
MKFLRIVVVCLAIISTAGVVRAQLPKTDALAAQMADAISKSDPKSVIVFDFWGPREALNALGQYLGQNFSRELAEQKRSFSMLDPDKIPAFCEKQKFSSSAVRDSVTAAWIGEELGAKAVIVGQLSVVDDKLIVAVTAYRTKTRTSVFEFKTEIPLNDEMRALLAKRVEYIPRNADENVPEAGKNGYGFPSCIRCAAAEYDSRAESERVQGTVVLIATIGTDGKARNFVVTKAVGYGLTEKAIETVSGWTFKPASSPDGQPAEVRQTVEVSFHLY